MVKQKTWRLHKFFALRELGLGVVVLQELVGREHRDAIPGADLVTKRAANAAGEVDRADLERELMPRAGDDADAIDGADGHAGFAAGTHVLVEEGENFGELLLCHGLLHCRSSIGGCKQIAEAEAILDSGTACGRGILD